MKKPLLRICDLHKSFTLHAVDGRLIEGLNGVELDIYEGEHVALAGTSGAGKSSLLKCIHRTYLSDSGSIEFNIGTGYEITTLTDDQIADLREHQIGYVSQFLKAEPRRGVKEIVIGMAHRGRLNVLVNTLGKNPKDCVLFLKKILKTFRLSKFRFYNKK